EPSQCASPSRSSGDVDTFAPLRTSMARSNFTGAPSVRFSCAIITAGRAASAFGQFATGPQLASGSFSRLATNSVVVGRGRLRPRLRGSLGSVDSGVPSSSVGTGLPSRNVGAGDPSATAGPVVPPPESD